MNDRAMYRQYVWCGPVAMVLIFGGWIVTGYFPPPSPNQSATTVAAYFVAHDDRIRVGLIILMFGVALLGPWVVAYAHAFRRIEGPASLTADLQLGFGMLLILEGALPPVALEVIALRPHQAPDLILPWFDAMWIPFIGFVFTYVVEVAFAGYAILSRRTQQDVFPDWLAYLGLGAGVTSIPMSLNVFARTGPLAWNGVFGFWIPMALFGAWVVAVTVVLLRADDLPASPAPTGLAGEVAELRRQVELLRSGGDRYV